jgi:nickel transport protein
MQRVALQRRVIAVLALVLALGLPSSALAHALHVLAKMEGNQVKVEAFFDDNSPAADAKVTVRDATGKVLYEGRTDGTGNWSFAMPAPGTYEIVVDDGAGHRTQKHLRVSGANADGSEQATAPTREELTQVPWLKVGIGIGAIVGFSLLVWLVRQRPPNHA